MCTKILRTKVHQPEQIYPKSLTGAEVSMQANEKEMPFFLFNGDVYITADQNPFIDFYGLHWATSHNCHAECWYKPWTEERIKGFAADGYIKAPMYNMDVLHASEDACHEWSKLTRFELVDSFN